MTLTPQPTAWATPVACSEARSSGQARPARPPRARVFRVSIPVPVPPLLSAPSWLPQAPPLLSRFYLRPRQPDAVAAEDPAKLGEGSAPEEVGVHAGPGPLAHPTFQGKEGLRS